MALSHPFSNVNLLGEDTTIWGFTPDVVESDSYSETVTPNFQLTAVQDNFLNLIEAVSATNEFDYLTSYVTSITNEDRSNDTFIDVLRAPEYDYKFNNNISAVDNITFNYLTSYVTSITNEDAINDTFVDVLRDTTQDRDFNRINAGITKQLGMGILSNAFFADTQEILLKQITEKTVTTTTSTRQSWMIF